jgi:2-haloacid dehalogenase/putative hydrolase of the HAD superfamily
VINFSNFKAVTFDCYGTLIDWETGISTLVRPWLQELGTQAPVDLVMSAFALMQAKHQQVRPTLLYPEVLRRTWLDIERTFGWQENYQHANTFAESVPVWPPFSDTNESLKYLKHYFKLGILSNVDNNSLAGTLRLLAVPFEVLVTAEDVGSYKPGLAHFETALTRFDALGISKDEILHVAQSKHHDIAPGLQIGLTTVWVNRRYGRSGSGATLATEAQPDLTVNSLAELVALLKAPATPHLR